MTRTMLMIAVACCRQPPTHSSSSAPGPTARSSTATRAARRPSKGTLKVTPMGTTPSEKELADAAAKAEAAQSAGAAARRSRLRKPAARWSVAATSSPAPTRSASTNLEVGQTRMGAYDEQKTAASLEMSAIRSGLDARMPSDAKSQAATGFMTDLSSTDAKKRKDSLNKLRELYSNY